MARHGENIRKRADGRWEGRYKAFDESKGREIYRSVYGHTYSEVKGKLMERKYISEKVLPQGNLVPEAGSTPQIEIPFAQLAMEWLTVVAERRKHSTYIKYEAVYKTHLEAVVGQCSLTAAANIELQGKISDHIAEVSPSESLQKSIICVANQILAFAGRKHAVSIPALKQSEKKQSRKPPEPLSKDEQASLLSYVFQETDKFSVAVLLCLYTGIRLGELCALKWTDIDAKDMVLRVDRTVQRIAAGNGLTKTVLMENTPKSPSSKRMIPLSKEVMAPLMELQGDQPYVFGGALPLEPRTMQYRFQKILGKAGISSKNFHILRHTFATNGIENGMDVKILSEILGHSDVKITLNRYVHPSMDTKRTQLGRLSGFYGQLGGHAA